MGRHCDSGLFQGNEGTSGVETRSGAGGESIESGGAHKEGNIFKLEGLGVTGGARVFAGAKQKEECQGQHVGYCKVDHRIGAEGQHRGVEKDGDGDGFDADWW